MLITGAETRVDPSYLRRFVERRKAGHIHQRTVGAPHHVHLLQLQYHSRLRVSEENERQGQVPGTGPMVTSS